MLHPITDKSASPTGWSTTTGATRKVVIVNGSPDTLQLFEMVLGAGHYDVVFVEANAHAYSQIKRVRPNLVILCVQIEEMAGFHVLTMLKLDEATRGIPVLTYTTECEGPDVEEQSPEFSDTQAFPVPAELMN